MIALKGSGVSDGIAEGKIVFYRRAELCTKRVKIQDTAKEIEKWNNARNQAKKQLEELTEKARSEAGNEAASLFETHILMLDDPDFTETVEMLIKNECINAEAAVEDTGKRFSEMFASMDDEYMQARSADVSDISLRILGIMAEVKFEALNKNGPAIIAADDLNPSETMQLDKKNILGFLLRNGSANSHTAILARTLGIPAVINLGDALKNEYENEYIMMDGSAGFAVIDPDNATRNYLSEKQCEEKAIQGKLEKLKGKEDVTPYGRKIKLYSNIASPADVHSVVENDSRGIGLFRSEFLYLERNSFPSEEEQFEAYSSVLKQMGNKTVIIRTLDIGADKQADYFNCAPEKNPALGMRAIRICLTRHEVFKTQLRALYRASVYGKLGIMFPMISSMWEVLEAKRICSVVCNELKEEGIPFDENVQLGIMIETPAAVMIANELAREVSFFSIGTNDLTQYTLAVDRESSVGMEKFYDTHHPAVMRMIKMTVDAAHNAGIWAGICGELAGDTSLTEKFLEMGVDELSVSPRLTLSLRRIIREFDM